MLCSNETGNGSSRHPAATENAIRLEGLPTVVLPWRPFSLYWQISHFPTSHSIHHAWCIRSTQDLRYESSVWSTNVIVLHNVGPSLGTPVRYRYHTLAQ
jgi:hypothetical protein